MNYTTGSGNSDYRQTADWRTNHRLLTERQLRELNRLGYNGGPRLRDWEAAQLLRMYRHGRGARRR